MLGWAKASLYEWVARHPGNKMNTAATRCFETVLGVKIAKLFSTSTNGKAIWGLD
jgi:hypothetical protein